MNQDYERQITPITPEIQAAIDELKEMIAERFPDTIFDVREQYEPPGISLTAIVDVDDTDEVFEVVVDRLIELQVYEHLPIYVTPTWPKERIWADFEARRASGVPWLQRSA
jgi:hypothetical protein